MAVPYTFSTATGSLPLSQLDSNFSTAITIGNTAVVLGDTITTINNLTLGNVAITSVSAAFPNGYLANSNVIVGTTTLTLGSTVTSINGLSLSNVTISSGNVTISNVTTTNVTATTANVTTANVGTLVVIGDATVGGNTTVTGNITAAKGTFTSANVTGTANVQVIAVTQNATVAGNATVTGNVSAANGTFTSANVSGTANVSTLAVVINATIGGNATVTGNVSMNVATITTANVSGTANISTLVITANQTSLGNITATGNVTAAKLIPTGTSVTGNGLYLPAANALGLSTNGTNAVYIDSSQNVGIGTSSPAGKLDVSSGNSYFAGLRLNGGNTTDTIYLATGDVGISAASASNIKFNTNNTERMRIDSSGNVGIGTSSPLSPLQIGTAAGSSPAGLTGLTFRQASGSPTAGYGYSVRWDNTQNVSNDIGTVTYAFGGASAAAAGYMTLSTASSERMRIDGSGNVYIETGLLWQYAPTPTTKAAAATLTAAELATDIITLTGTTYTITLPTGTALDTYYTGVPAVNIGYDFHIVNTASGIITIAVGASGMTSVGLLTVAATVSAHFRLRRTAANTYILYRLS